MKYLKQYREMHEAGKFNGKSLKKHLKVIQEYLDKLECKTVLDYGCGKAKYHPEGWNKYDPGVKEFDVLPDGKFDAVICTDVLEHVPEEELDETLNTIFSKANKFVYLSISTKPARKTLPNGENAHCTIHDPTWWTKRFPKHEVTLMVAYD